MTALWIGQAHASQRDVVSLIRASEDWATVLASHEAQREDILAVANRSFREPGRDELGTDAASSYAGWMLEMARAEGVGAVLCTRYREALTDWRGEFSRHGVRLTTGAAKRADLRVTEYKDTFAERISRVAALPRTVRVEGSREFLAGVASFAPSDELCVKPVKGVYGRGFLRLRRDADLLGCLTSLEDRAVSVATFAEALESAVSPEPFLLMEYLPGDEYSVDMVCDAGEVLAIASRLKKPHFQIVETEGKQVELARTVASELKLDGIVNVQTKAASDGAQRVLEANSRISGGVGFSAPAGVNLPAAWARHVTGRPVHARRLREPVAVRVTPSACLLPSTTARLSTGAA